MAKKKQASLRKWSKRLVSCLVIILVILFILSSLINQSMGNVLSLLNLSESSKMNMTTTKDKQTENEQEKQTDNNSDPKTVFANLIKELGLSEKEQQAWAFIIEHESNWQVNAKNKSSGAYGLGQALPASKMAKYGADYLTNPKTQLLWMKNYMQSRYGGILPAYQFWLQNKWY